MISKNVNLTKITYANSNWQDQLTKYDNESITYDAIGNPLIMGDKTFTWRNGRELASYSNTNNNVSYIYNNDGIRTSKTVNNVTTNYYLKGNKIVFEEKNNTMLYFIYNNDELVGFKYNGNIYHYHKNLFGDVIGIYDSNNNEIVTYEYDSWGAIVNTIDNSNINLSTINPFRYRSYYYDEETKLYYLNSRYYNPKVGRFINADAYVSTGQGTIGHNMYNYCGNNPVNRSDDLGIFWIRMMVEFFIDYFRALFGINDNDNSHENYVVSYREDNSIYQNCYSYAFKLDKMSNPGAYAGIDFLEKKVHTVDEVASYVMADMKALNKDVRIIKTIDRANSDEYVVALKVSDIPLSSLGGYADYHFAVYLSDRSWADKPGRTPSRKGVIKSGVAPWDCGEIKGYYNSETIFFAVKE